VEVMAGPSIGCRYSPAKAPDNCEISLSTLWPPRLQGLHSSSLRRALDGQQGSEMAAALGCSKQPERWLRPTGFMQETLRSSRMDTSLFNTRHCYQECLGAWKKYVLSPPPALLPACPRASQQLRAPAKSQFRGQTDGFGAQMSTLKLTRSSSKDSHSPASAPKVRMCCLPPGQASEILPPSISEHGPAKAESPWAGHCVPGTSHQLTLLSSRRTSGQVQPCLAQARKPQASQ
jgi:hypothetical protein